MAAGIQLSSPSHKPDLISSTLLSSVSSEAGARGGAAVQAGRSRVQLLMW